jgi:hypothetical protein
LPNRGENRITLQIQPIISKNKDSQSFRPKLYYKVVGNLGEVKDTIDFPPNGDLGFIQQTAYNARGFMQISIKHVVATNDTGILFKLYAPPKKGQTERQPIDVNVFASTGNDHLLA